MFNNLEAYVKTCREQNISYRSACEDFQRTWLEHALKSAGNNQLVLAEEIGVHRNTLGRALKHLDIKITEKKVMRKHV